MFYIADLSDHCHLTADTGGLSLLIAKFTGMEHCLLHARAVACTHDHMS